MTTNSVVSFELVTELDTEPFGYDDKYAWLAFIGRIDAAIREHDPWLMIGQRPDCDVFVIDTVGNWPETVNRLNVRSVRLYRLVERSDPNRTKP